MVQCKLRELTSVVIQLNHRLISLLLADCQPIPASTMLPKIETFKTFTGVGRAGNQGPGGGNQWLAGPGGLAAGGGSWAGRRLRAGGPGRFRGGGGVRPRVAAPGQGATGPGGFLAMGWHWCLAAARATQPTRQKNNPFTQHKG